MRLIINADDFGYSRAVNYGIQDSFTEGVLTSTTMMMNAIATEHAVQLAKQHLTLGVGVHLVLTSGKPLSDDVPSLTIANGNFKSRQELFQFKNIDPQDVFKEWTAQIEKFLAFGLKPTHLDSHHYVHSIPALSDVIFTLAKKYRLPVRNDFGTKKPPEILATDVFCKDFYDKNTTLDTFYKLKVSQNHTIEVMCHPGYIDETLLTNSSYHLPRAKEVEILTSSVLKGWLKEHQVQLINYTHL